jgi:hypothetical protein
MRSPAPAEAGSRWVEVAALCRRWPRARSGQASAWPLSSARLSAAISRDKPSQESCTSGPASPCSSVLELSGPELGHVSADLARLPGGRVKVRRLP